MFLQIRNGFWVNLRNVMDVSITKHGTEESFCFRMADGNYWVAEKEFNRIIMELLDGSRK